MAIRSDEITPPDSSTALQPGGFKARDEARRAEQAQARKLKLSERLDRNIMRAGRKGDGSSVNTFLNIKRALQDGTMQAPGGITSYEDREQRVKDGVIKGAEARWELGRVGRTGEDNAFAGAPPADTATPKERPEAVNPNSTAGTNGTPIKRGESIEVPPVAQGVVTGDAAAPSAKTAPQATQEAVAPAVDIKGRQAFAADLDRSTLVKNGDSDAIARAYQRGEQLGLDTDAVDRYIRGGKQDTASAKKYDAEFGASDAYVNQAVNNLDPTKFTPEQITQIRSNTQKLSPQERKDAKKKGEAPLPSRDLSADEIAFGDRVASAVRKVNDLATAASGRAENALAKANESSLKSRQTDEARIAKRDAGFARAEELLQSTLGRNEQAYKAQKGITDAYFEDVVSTEQRNANQIADVNSFNPFRVIPALFKGGLMNSGIERLPQQPDPVNYDTFDPANPPKYQRKLPSSTPAGWKGLSRGSGPVKQRADLQKMESDSEEFYRSKVKADLEQAITRYQAPNRNSMPL